MSKTIDRLVCNEIKVNEKIIVETNLDLNGLMSATGQILTTDDDGVTTKKLNPGSENDVLTVGPGNVLKWAAGGGGGGGSDFSSNTGTTSDDATADLRTITTATNIAYFVEAVIIGRRTDNSGSGETYIGEIKAAFKNIEGTLTAIGSEDAVVFKDSGVTCSSTILVSGTSIIIRVTGQVGSDISWKSSSRAVTV